jgi:hypothetical protein
MDASKKPWLIKSISLANAQNMVGEQLYVRIHKLYPKIAAKLTGMILERFSVEECDMLLEDDVKFQATVQMGVDVLAGHGLT